MTGDEPADAGREGSAAGDADAADAMADPIGALLPEDAIGVLDADGNVRPDASVPDLDDETLVGMYRDMRISRRFDERAVSLQRQGRIGTYAPLAGQEGSQIGSTYALEDRDYITYQYREHGAVVVREALPEYLPYWMGHESGNAALADVNVFPLNISIGAHVPHAVGMAWAMDYRDEDRVVMCHFGDGATSEGDFHEAANFAGVFDTPTVFVCHNNGWAISIPAERQTASDTFAAKAEAYGFDGVRVDGMDPLAVYQVVSEAVDRARTPDGDGLRPTLVETIEYRYGAHTTADDPSVYREEEELEAWRQLDPIDRMESFLRDTGRLDDERIDAIEAEADERVAAAVDAASDLEAAPAAMFQDVYAEPTPEIERQRDELLRQIQEHGEDAFLRDE